MSRENKNEFMRELGAQFASSAVSSIGAGFGELIAVTVSEKINECKKKKKKTNTEKALDNIEKRRQKYDVCFAGSKKENRILRQRVKELEDALYADDDDDDDDDYYY